MTVKKKIKITKKANTYYIKLSKPYSELAEFSETLDPPPQISQATKKSNIRPTNNSSVFKMKATRRRKSRLATYIGIMNENGILDMYVHKAEDECTIMAKNNSHDKSCVTIHAVNAKINKTEPTLLHQGKNAGYAFSTEVGRLTKKFIREGNQFRFTKKSTVATYNKNDETFMVTYESRADGHYLS